MKWYNGGISDAVSFSKSKGAVFVVYIEGTDENSQKITDLIDNGELGKKLEQDYFVAVKVKAGSTSHQQFSEIYKEPSVPSIYFIGKNGVPLDIITGSTNLDNVSARINDIISRADIDVVNAQSISTPALSETFIKNEQSDNKSPKVKCEGDVCRIVNDEETEEKLDKEDPVVVEDQQGSKEDLRKDEGSSSKVEVTAQEKLDRAKELIELKRQQKEKEERENERLKELERRKMGQSVQQLKKWQEDQELKQLIEDRDREKRENQLARERVLAQIAQDRAERMSKSPPKPAEAPKATPTQPKPASNITRLQFKLPDGSTVTNEFRISDTLECVVSFVRCELHVSNFTLATTFPRKEFTKNDYPSSLVDLQLVPNAVILILPTNNLATTTRGGFVSDVLWSILSPIIGLWGYLKSLVFGTDSTRARRTSPPPNEPTASIASKGSSKRRAGGDSTVVRRQGNIHRLTDQKDSDDENSTYNGNSTQQM